jgi:hypothetical protein
LPLYGVIPLASKPETNFRNNIVNPFLKTLRNTWACSVQQISTIGTPDKLLCINGTFVALELKDRKGKLSTLQKHNLSLIKEAGGIALVADQDTWMTVKDILLHLDRGI